MTNRTPHLLDYAGVFLVAGAGLGLEIVLTRILALMMWHHFTYAVIAVGLLGFAAAGSYLAIRHDEDPAPVSRRLSRGSLWFGLTIPLAYVALTRVKIAPLEIRGDPREMVSLLVIFALITIPFFFGGLVICDAIRSFRGRVGTIYFADLVGAATGAVVAVVLLQPLTGPGVVIAFGIVACVAALAFESRELIASRRPGSVVSILVYGLVIAFLALVALPHARTGELDPPIAPKKDLATMQSEQGFGENMRTFWDPVARIDVSPEFEFAPGMGGAFPEGTKPIRMHVATQDGTALLVYHAWNPEPGAMDYLGKASAAAGHVVARARETKGVEELVIGVGGGVDLMIGVHFGVKRVTGAEINGTTVRLLREDYLKFTGGLVERPDVELVHAEGRHFVRAGDRKFDVIQLSGVDTYTALASGAQVLSESYLYTVEGVREFLQALEPGGVLGYTRFVFPERPRESLRLVATGLETLESLGVEDARRCVYVLEGNGWASMLFSRDPFEPKVLAALRAFCRENGYPVLYDPEERHDNRFDDLLRRTRSEREKMYEEYPFDIRPALDDRPFFFNYYRWSGMLRDVDVEYQGILFHSPYPVGHMCLVLTLVQTLVLGLFLILRPLRRLRRLDATAPIRSTFLYFAALGVGFITIEIVLMQHLVLFVGHPTYSLTTVLPAMLFAAGLGSLTVRPTTNPRKRLRFLAIAAPVVILGSWWLTANGIDRFLHWPFAARVALTVAAVTPVAFILGMAFPTGVRALEDEHPGLVPWAWAINGLTTVFGSTAAVVVAMETGFSAAMIAMAPLYLVGIVAMWIGSRPARTAGAPVG